MKKFMLIMSILFCFMLIGCGNNAAKGNTNDQNIEVKNISAHRMIDQAPSNEAKEILKKQDEVTGIKAVNTSQNILVAVEIKHRKRFELKKIKEELTSKLKDNFRNFHVELTIDKKIFLELDKLEEKIHSHSIKPAKLGKEIERITKLSKEKT